MKFPGWISPSDSPTKPRPCSSPPSVLMKRSSSLPADLKPVAVIVNPPEVQLSTFPVFPLHGALTPFGQESRLILSAFAVDDERIIRPAIAKSVTILNLIWCLLSRRTVQISSSQPIEAREVPWASDKICRQALL